jgi:hypothetical protein
MLRSPFLLINLLLLALTPSTFAAQQATYSCEGSLFEPNGSSHSFNATLTMGSSSSIDIGKGPARVAPISNNKIQFKFAAKGFTGEYFHYTHDLFLIYKSGHLARLTCSPR